MAEKLEEYIAQLSARDDKVRKSAVRAIAALPGDSATEALETAAKDENPGVRFLAKNALKKRKAGVIITTATAKTIEEAPSPSPAKSANSTTKSAKGERKRISTSSLKPVQKKPAPISRRPSQGAAPAQEKKAPQKALPSAPMPKDLAPIKPLGASELVSKTFSIYGALSWKAMAALAIVNIPVAAFSFFHFFLVAIAPSAQAAITATTLMNFIAIPFRLFANWFGPAVMMKMVVDKIFGRQVDLWSAFSYCWEKKMVLFSAAIVAWFLWTCGAILGTVALVLPGLVFMLWAYTNWAFVPIVSVLEDKGSYSACARSAQLASYDTVNLFGRLFVLGIITFLLSLVVTIPIQILSSLIGSLSINILFSSAANLLSTVVFAPISCIGLVLLYFSQRVEFEGYSEEEMTRQLKG